MCDGVEGVVGKVRVCVDPCWFFCEVEEVLPAPAERERGGGTGDCDGLNKGQGTLMLL